MMTAFVKLLEWHYSCVKAKQNAATSPTRIVLHFPAWEKKENGLLHTSASACLGHLKYINRYINETIRSGETRLLFLEQSVLKLKCTHLFTYFGWARSRYENPYPWLNQEIESKVRDQHLDQEVSSDPKQFAQNQIGSWNASQKPTNIL